MASRNIPFIIHPAKGGLDTTKAATLLEPDQLTVATNIEYDTSGSRKKRLGTTRYNATAVAEAGNNITFTDLQDFWLSNSDGTWTQKFVATGGTGIWKDDLDGVWDSGVTGWGTNSSDSNIVIAQNLAIFANDNNDTPRKWDQTTFAALAGTPPNFSFAVYHLRRLWVAGIRSTPSLIDFSAAGNVETWAGADTDAPMTFDEDDGDRIIGLSQPFRNRLYVFKGPHTGSVHEITGATLSAFARNKLFSGLPCGSHKSIVTTPNDIFWASRYGIHSLATTQKYGDLEEAFLSRPIQTTYRAMSLTDARLRQIVGFYHPTRNVVGWCVPAGGTAQNSQMFVYNIALSTWSTWVFTGFNPACARVMLTPATAVPRLYIGGYAGRVHAGDQATLSDDNADQAYTATVTTPVYLKLSDAANELSEKSYYSITTFFRPKGNYNATLTVLVDRRSQTANVSMAGGADTLG